jgi:hypothetical protein
MSQKQAEKGDEKRLHGLIYVPSGYTLDEISIWIFIEQKLPFDDIRNYILISDV